MHYVVGAGYVTQQSMCAKVTPVTYLLTIDLYLQTVLGRAHSK